MIISHNREYSRKPGNPEKLGIRTTGPYTILQTHVNGTVTIEL
jgi:hypothetical protein